MRETILALGALCGAFASIFGVMKIAYALRTRFRDWRKRRKEKREAPMRELIAEMKEQRRMLDEMNRRIERMEETDRRVKDSVEVIEKKVSRLGESVATIQADRLNQAYDFYVDKRHPCPMSIKSSLTRMHEQYTEGGHNHLHASYIERLEACPTE